MTQEEKELLLKDLSARLPYNVECDRLGRAYQLVDIDIKRGLVSLLRDEAYVPYSISRGDIVKPYLRPLSSMTEEEEKEFEKVFDIELKALEAPEGHTLESAASSAFVIDFYNKYHFDYRGLIEKGLALEAPKGMY